MAHGGIPYFGTVDTAEVEQVLSGFNFSGEDPFGYEGHLKKLREIADEVNKKPAAAQVTTIVSWRFSGGHCVPFLVVRAACMILICQTDGVGTLAGFSERFTFFSRHQYHIVRN